MNEVDIESIHTGERWRKDLGDLEALKNSIKENGLLQPIVLSRDRQGTYRLVAGLRRLEAMRSLGRTKIPARVIGEDKAKQAEIEENVKRKAFTPSELARIADYLESVIAPEIRREGEERAKAAAAKGGSYGGLSKVRRTANQEEFEKAKSEVKEAGSETPVDADRHAEQPLKKRRLTREEVAGRLGMSERQLRKLRKVCKAAENDPRIGQIVSDMDAGRCSIEAAHRRMGALKEPKRGGLGVEKHPGERNGMPPAPQKELPTRLQEQLEATGEEHAGDLAANHGENIGWMDEKALARALSLDPNGRGMDPPGKDETAVAPRGSLSKTQKKRNLEHVPLHEEMLAVREAAERVLQKTHKNAVSYPDAVEFATVGCALFLVMFHFYVHLAKKNANFEGLPNHLCGPSLDILKLIKELDDNCAFALAASAKQETVAEKEERRKSIWNDLYASEKISELIDDAVTLGKEWKKAVSKQDRPRADTTSNQHR